MPGSIATTTIHAISQWFSYEGKELRIDHAFVSPTLAGRDRKADDDHASRAIAQAITNC